MRGRELSKLVPCRYTVSRLIHLIFLSICIFWSSFSFGASLLYHQATALILFCDYQHTFVNGASPQIIQFECAIYFLLSFWLIQRIMREKILALSLQSAFSVPQVLLQKLYQRRREDYRIYTFIHLVFFTAWSFSTSNLHVCVYNSLKFWYAVSTFFNSAKSWKLI